MNPKFGKDKILMFRKLGTESNKNAEKLALQMEHELSLERETNSTATKDGTITSDGGLEVTLSITAVASGDEVNEMLYNSVKDGYKLECWEIDLSSPGTEENKFKAKYMQGRLNSWSIPANVEDTVEIETEFVIDGVPQDGEVTLTAAQQTTIQYAFKDITKTDRKSVV